MSDAFLSPAVQIYLKGSGLDQSLRGHLTASSMIIDHSRTTISPRPGPRSPGAPVMNTLFGFTPLAGIVQFSPLCTISLILNTFILLAPLCQSLWIPVLLKNVIISYLTLAQTMKSSSGYEIHMLDGKFSRMRLFFLEGLKKRSPCASGYDLH